MAAGHLGGLPHNASASLRGSWSRVWPASHQHNRHSSQQTTQQPSTLLSNLKLWDWHRIARFSTIAVLKVTNMGIKRKHLDDASPTSISSSGFVSTPDAQSPTRFPQGLDGTADMDMDAEPTPRTGGWDFSRAQRTKSSDWGLRTRKRVRDNRPDERVIQGTQLSTTA